MLKQPTGAIETYLVADNTKNTANRSLVDTYAAYSPKYAFNNISHYYKNTRAKFKMGPTFVKKRKRSQNKLPFKKLTNFIFDLRRMAESHFISSASEHEFTLETAEP